MTGRPKRGQVRCQVLITVDPDRWEDSAAWVEPAWIDEMNDRAKQEGATRDVLRIHPDHHQARPAAISFPTSAATVRWMSGHER